MLSPFDKTRPKLFKVGLGGGNAFISLSSICLFELMTDESPESFLACCIVFIDPMERIESLLECNDLTSPIDLTPSPFTSVCFEPRDDIVTIESFVEWIAAGGVEISFLDCIVVAVESSLHAIEGSFEFGAEKFSYSSPENAYVHMYHDAENIGTC